MTPPAAGSFAARLNHTLLDPELANSQVVEELTAARRRRVGAVTVRPCDADLAVRALTGSETRAAGAVGYPYGFQNTGVKLYEARDLLRRGIQEIALAVDISRLLSREFQHLQTELDQVTEACRAAGAKLVASLDCAHLARELKIIACTCFERAEVDGVAIAQSFAPGDLELLRKHLPDETAIEVSGVATVDEALQFETLGCARFGTAVPALLLDEWTRRFAPPPAES